MIKPSGPSSSQVGAVVPGNPVERVRGNLSRLLVAVGPTPAVQTGFVIGESVTARWIEPLQNRQWLVLVKGSAFTLQLPAIEADLGTPHSLMPARGETLELKVVALPPRLGFALPVAAASTTGGSAVAVQLSDAARTLSSLTNASERGLANSEVLGTATLPLVNPAAPAAERAQALAQAVSHSGLFYESHLLAWAEGRLPLSSLALEPQAHVAAMLKDADPATREAASAELGAVLQRQLDALDGRPLAFSGLAWPGQPAELRFRRDVTDPRDDEATDRPPSNIAPSSPAWTTQIHLDLPRLGALGAQVRVIGSQVSLAVTLGSELGAGLLATHRGRLASALQAVGLNLTELSLQTAAQAPLSP